jgi:uncharacterized protein YebE (UPF0316 family)
MDIGLDFGTLLTGILIFLARIGDVTIGTVRTFSIVQGRTKMAFFLGFVEISVWLIVISAVVTKITSSPLLALFYALGFSTGNVVGIMVEKKLAFGNIILRVITRQDSGKMRDTIREVGYGVTTFQGEGMNGPVMELYIVCRRKDLKEIMPIITRIDPDAFYTTEQAGIVSRMYRPTLQTPTGWRAIFKKK